MTAPKPDGPEQVEKLVETAELAGGVDSDRFKAFLDHMPLAVAVAEFRPEAERIVYANARFEEVAGVPLADLVGRGWEAAPLVAEEDGAPLAEMLACEGATVLRLALPESAGENGGAMAAEVHATVIEDDAGRPAYRLIALTRSRAEDAEERLRAADTRLRELQHRVKNNLQMITALIRLEARNAGDEEGPRFDRLAGRVAALGILYETLADEAAGDQVDLGVYLTQIATSVMASHATEGVRLELAVDAFPVSVNVAMPAGLVVNELMTNALKHAFRDRDGGVITLRGVVEDGTCTVAVADDGIGLPPGETWPKPGRLGALIVRSLEENAGARLETRPGPEGGTVVEIRFGRAAAAPEAPAAPAARG